MPCEVIDLGGGATAIVRRPNAPSRKCSVCKRLTRDVRLCDYYIGGGKTCDRPLCTACAQHVDPDLDYCPQHGALLGPGGKLRVL